MKIGNDDGPGLWEMSEEDLWEAVVEWQGRPLRTMSGLEFSYRLKRGRNGELNRELVIDRRENSKTVVWSSVLLAFRAAAKRRGQVVSRPKELGDIRGISYIYPLLWRLGVIEVPEDVAERMGSEPCDGAAKGQHGSLEVTEKVSEEKGWKGEMSGESEERRGEERRGEMRHYGVDSFMGCAGLHGLLFFNTFAGFLKRIYEQDIFGREGDSGHRGGRIHRGKLSEEAVGRSGRSYSGRD